MKPVAVPGNEARRPLPCCLPFNTGILCHRDDTNNPDEDHHFHIVAMEYSEVRWQLHLHLFDSKTRTNKKFLEDPATARESGT